MFSKKMFAVVFIHFISLGDCRCPRRNPCEPSPCDPNATCNRMGRSFQCVCKDGYSGDGSICEATDPPPFYNFCAVGEVCYADGTNCTGVPEPGNPCTSNAECPSDFCHFGRCRCNADGNAAFRLDTSGQCVTSCQTFGTTFSYYPQRAVAGGWDYIESHFNQETCFSECLKNDACNMVQFVDYVCEPQYCDLFNVSTNTRMVSSPVHIYIRNCA